MRKILHVDMDAFYASVEQRDNPVLQGRPIAVAGSGRSGVVMTACYEARKYGVHSAMSAAHAQRLCRDLILVPPRFDAYKEASVEIQRVFGEFTDLVEPLSLDEAFLDVTEAVNGPPSATLVAVEIKRRIRHDTGLSCSAGVGPNKFVAKVASGLQKPDGLTVVRPEEVSDFVASLPITQFFGVGPVTARRFHLLGIRSGGDLRLRSRAELARHFGKAGHWYYGIARGIDNRPVEVSRARKSISAERTFTPNVADLEQMKHRIREIADEVSRRMRKNELSARIVTIKIKYHDFETSTRSKTLAMELTSRHDLARISSILLEESRPARPVRLLGVAVGKLTPEHSPGTQMPLGLD